MIKIETALAYIKIGYSVIPVKSPSMFRRSISFKTKMDAAFAENSAKDNPRSVDEVYQELFNRQCKIPLVAWEVYQERFATKEEITKWFTTNPDANIGIVTGEISNLIVIDLDSEEAVKHAEEWGGFPENTPKVKTDRGCHIYIKHPCFEIRNFAGKGLKIDIRADGNFVVAPPSIHGSGFQYEWVEGRSITDIDPVVCPKWLVEYLKETARHETEPKPQSLANNGPDYLSDLLLETMSKEIACALTNFVTTEMDYVLRKATDDLGIGLSEKFREMAREYFENTSGGTK